VPFTEALQAGMEEAAEVAGIEVITCDSKFDAAEALSCARQFRTREVDGLVTFQADAAAAANICAEGPQVPVIAIDIEQQPCQTTFVGAANEYAGVIVGDALGRYFRENFDCAHDAWISLESLAVGIGNDQRMDGIRQGFEAVCGPALIAPLLPAVRPGGRPRTTCLRRVVDAIFYLLQAGCQWRMLPKDFPPRSTVYGYFRRGSRPGSGRTSTTCSIAGPGNWRAATRARPGDHRQPERDNQRGSPRNSRVRRGKAHQRLQAAPDHRHARPDAARRGPFRQHPGSRRCGAGPRPDHPPLPTRPADAPGPADSPLLLWLPAAEAPCASPIADGNRPQMSGGAGTRCRA
jgi:Putative transposase of IS4/5 family (DUF4096)/Periplasmic binding protein domain